MIDHRYHALFDAAAAIGVDLVLDEKYHPCAGDTLRIYATLKAGRPARSALRCPCLGRQVDERLMCICVEPKEKL